MLLCTHFIKSRLNVGYCNTHFAFKINLAAIVTMPYLLCNGPLLHNIPHSGVARNFKSRVGHNFHIFSSAFFFDGTHLKLIEKQEKL